MKMNPLGQLPFLTHGNIKIGESSAILLYLVEKFEALPKSLMGETKEQRAKVNQYLSWYQYSYRPALFKLILIKIYGKLRKGTDFEQFQIKSANRQMTEAIKLLDQLLAGRNYIATENLTIADLLFYF